MGLLITQSELASYLPDSVNDQYKAALMIDLTEALIYSYVDAAHANGNLVAKGVALEVAARAFRNADGFSSETIDDYTYRRDLDTRRAGVYLTADEKSTLERLSPTPRTRARSVKLTNRLSGLYPT